MSDRIELGKGLREGIKQATSELANESGLFLAKVKELESKTNTAMQNLVNAMTGATLGANYYSFYSNIASAVDMVAQSYNRFIAVQNAGGDAARQAAEELVKWSNAMKGMAGTDLASSGKFSVDQIQKMEQAIASARSMVDRGTLTLFSDAEMSRAADMFRILQESGVSAEKMGAIFSALSSQVDFSNTVAQLDAAEAKVADLTNRFYSAENQIENLSNELQTSQNYSYIDELRSRIEDLTRSATYEFDSFLKTMNLDSVADGYGWTSDFINDMFDQIKTGAKTSSEAISEVKNKLGFLIEENWQNSDGMFNTSALNEFTVKLEQIIARVEDVRAEVNGLSENGVKLIGGSGSDVQQGTQSFEQLATSVNDFSGASQNASGAMESVAGGISGISGALKELAATGDSSLTLIRGILNAISAIGQGSFTAKSFDNLVNGLNKLSAFKDTSALEGLSRISFANWKELKVSKAALSNLTEFLPKISEINVDNLQKVASMDFSKFKEISIPKNVSDGFQTLAQSFTEITNAVSGVEQSIAKSTAAITAEGKAAESAAKAKEKLAAAEKSISGNIDNSAITESTAQIKAEGEAAAQTAEQKSKLSLIARTGLAESASGTGGTGGDNKFGTLLRQQTEFVEGFTRVTQVYEDAASRVVTTVRSLYNAETSELESGSVSITQTFNATANQISQLSTTIENKITNVISLMKSLQAINGGTESGAYSSLNDILANLYDARTAISADGADYNAVQRDVNLISAAYTQAAAAAKEFTQANTAANTAANQTSNLSKTIENKMTAVSVLMNSLQAIGGGGTEAYSSLNDILFNLGDALQSLKSGSADYSTIKQGLNDIDVAYTKASASAKEFTQANTAANTAANRESSLSKQIENRMTDVANLMKTLQAVGGAASEPYAKLSDIFANLEGLSNVLSAGGADYNAVGRSLNSVETAYHEAAAAANDFVKANNAANSSANQASGLNKQIENRITAVKSLMDSLAAMNGGTSSEEYANLNNILATLQGLSSSLKSGSVNFDTIRQGLDGVDIAFKKASQSAKEFKTNAAMGKGSATYNKYYAQIENWITRISEAQKNWSSAASSGAKESYNALGRLKDQLQQLLNNMGGMSEGAVKSALSGITAEFSKIKEQITGANAATSSFGTKLKSLGTQITQLYLTPMRLLMTAIRGIKEMISESIELQSEMAELQIVTGASNTEMTEYSKQAIQSAKELAISAEDMISATTTYSRLGFSLEESDQMARLTAMLEKVGDIDASDAQDAITAIMMAFSDEVDSSNLELVMDKLVEVGNNFPISVEQLATGMNNASSSLAAAGNSFDQSVALLTAANTTVQDASKASTALRTITARLRKTDTELEELGEEELTSAHYEEILEALSDQNVQITDMNGEYRSTYDILKDIADIWDDLTSGEQAGIAEAVAGTRQQSIFYSIIENFNQAEGAMEAMTEAGGQMSSAYEVYTDTTEAHIQTLKDAITELSSDLMQSEMLNFFVDLATRVVEAADKIVVLINKVGGLQTVLGLLATTLVAAHLDSIVVKILNISIGIERISKLFSTFGTTALNALRSLNTSTTTLATSAQLAASSYTQMQAAIIGIGLLTSAVSLIKSKVQERLETSRAENDEIIAAGASMADEAQSLRDLYLEYEKAGAAYDAGIGGKEALEEATSNLAEALGVEESALDGVVEKLQEMTEAEYNAAFDKAEGAVKSAKENLLDAVKTAESTMSRTDLMSGSKSGRMISWEDGFGTTTAFNFSNMFNDGTDALQSFMTSLYQSFGYYDWGATEEDKVNAVMQSYEALLKMKQELSESDQTDTVAYAMVTAAISALEGDVKALETAEGDLEQLESKMASLSGQVTIDIKADLNGEEPSEALQKIKDAIAGVSDVDGDGVEKTAEDIMADTGSEAYLVLSAAADEYGLSLSELLSLLTEFGYLQEAVADDTTAAAKKYAEVSEAFTKVKDEYSALSDALSEQGYGDTLTLETYEALLEASEDYASCLEYENGTMQLNAEKARDLYEAKSEVQIAELELQSAMSKALYEENAKEIADLEKAYTEAELAENTYYQNLVKENAQLSTNIDKYSLMRAELIELSSAYSAWQSAQNSGESGDMYDDMQTALEQIQEGLESGKTGSGNVKYTAAVDLLVPEVSRDDVSSYVASLQRYLTEDSTGVTNFVSDLIANGFAAAGRDTLTDFLLADGTTINDICDALQITPEMAKAIFGELEEYPFEFEWTDEDFDLASAEQKIETLQSRLEELKTQLSEGQEIGIDADASEIDSFISRCEALQTKIAELQGTDLTIEANASALEAAKGELDALIAEAGEKGIELNISSESSSTQSQLEALVGQLDQIAAQADAIAGKAIGTLGADAARSALQSVYNMLIKINAYKIANKSYTVTEYKKTVNKGLFSSAGGTTDAPGGNTLVGELGRELVVSGDHYYTVGDTGAEFVNLQPGDIVFNHLDTEKIMAGITGARGTALKDGNAAAGIKGGGGFTNVQPVYISSGGTTSTTSSDDNWFEQQYKLHNHLIEMEQEDQETYLKWLESAYQQAYSQGLFEIDDYYKYEEEVFQLYKDLFDDWVNDTEFEISQLERSAGDNTTLILQKYGDIVTSIQNQIAAAEARGLDQNDDYIQELYEQLWDYQDKIKDLQEETADDAKDTLEELIQYRIKMLKQDIENEKDALNDKLDALRDFYDEQKEMLQDAYDEEQYLEEQSEKRKSVSDIQAELAQLEFDNSAWAAKRKLELQESLIDAQKELSDFEKDHALEMVQDELDAKYDAQEEEINAQIDQLDDMLNDPYALYNQALNDIRAFDYAMYQQMVEFNRKYDTGNDDDINEMIEAAYLATGYKGTTYKGASIGNYTGYASGTSSATAGLHKLDELGSEYLFTSSDGGRYRVLSSGDKVLNAGATDFLYNFANSGGEVLSKMVSSAASSVFSGLANLMGNTEIRTGDIIIQGNADMQTVSEIRRAQRENLETILKSINKLNR